MTLHHDGRRPRPRAAWAALITSSALSVLLVAGVLLPILGLIGSAGATTLGVLRIPVGAITVSVVIGYLVALGFLALTALSRIGAVAWITGVAAVIAAAVGSTWPLVATALAGADQARDIIPFVQGLLGH